MQVAENATAKACCREDCPHLGKWQQPHAAVFPCITSVSGVLPVRFANWAAWSRPLCHADVWYRLCLCVRGRRKAPSPPLWLSRHGRFTVVHDVHV